MATLNGSLMTLFITENSTTKPIGYTTSCSLEISAGSRDISHKGSGGWEASDYARNSWTVSAEGFVSMDDTNTNITTLNDFIIEKKTLTAKIALQTAAQDYTEDVTVGNVSYSGDCIIESVSFDMPDNDNATYSVSLKGITPLAKTVIAI